jgi:hypothetical protein
MGIPIGAIKTSILERQHLREQRSQFSMIGVPLRFERKQGHLFSSLVVVCGLDNYLGARWFWGGVVL